MTEYRFNLFTGKGDEQITVKSESEKNAEIQKGRTVLHPSLAIKKSAKHSNKHKSKK